MLNILWGKYVFIKRVMESYNIPYLALISIAEIAAVLLCFTLKA